MGGTIYFGKYFSDDDLTEKETVRVLNVDILYSPVQSGQDVPIIDPIPDENHVNEIANDFINMNETFVSKAATFDVSKGGSENVPTLSVTENAMPVTSIDPKNKEESEKSIQLPIHDIPGHDANEELLDYGFVYEDALVS